MSSAVPVTPDDVLRASAAVGDRLHRTPMFSSATLSRETGARVFLKAELFQRTGSFKPRGLLAKLVSLSPEERRRGVVTVSAGNAAAAVAYGSALEGIDALVCMWQGASALKVAAVRGYGATVDQEAADPTEAFARAAEFAERDGRTFVHPFDDDTVIAGHGSLGVELVEDRPDVEVVVVPDRRRGSHLGRRGRREGRASRTRASSASSPRAPTGCARALEAGEPVPITPVSIADGLNAPYAGGRCLLVCRALSTICTSSRTARSSAASAFSTSAPSSPRSPPRRPESARSWPGRSPISRARPSS